MPFKLAKSPTFRSTVTIETMDEKGRSVKEIVHAIFRRPTEDELSDWNGKNNTEVLGEFLQDVEGLQDGEGNAVPFADNNRLALLNIPPATFALAAAFWQGARMGRTKNS